VCRDEKWEREEEEDQPCEHVGERERNARSNSLAAFLYSGGNKKQWW
jgi:hypothetical protein